MRSWIVLLMIFPLAVAAQSIEKAKKYIDDKKPEEAKKLLLAINDSHKDYADGQYWLGRIAFNEKDYDQAEEYFEEAVERNDKVADYHYWYASTLGTIAKDANTIRQGMLAPKIKHELERTIALDPANLEARQTLIEFYIQAPGFMGGSWEKAEETAKGILKIKEAEGHRALGNVYEPGENQ